MPTDSEQSQRFTACLRQCQSPLLRYIFALVRNSADAQDVFQQTCLVLWDKFDEFDSNRCFLAWACGVARFKAHKFLLQHHRYRARFTEEFAQRMAEIQVDLGPGKIDLRREALPDCIEKLPPLQRELLRLCYNEDQRVADVAAKLGRPARGVHNSLKLIREKLLECIDRTVREEER